MVSLVVYFRWNWVGMVISDEDLGTQFLSEWRGVMKRNIVCLAFVAIIPLNRELYWKMFMNNYNKVMTSSAKVVIVYGDRDSYMAFNFWMWKPLKVQRIWVSVSKFDMFIEGDFMLNSPDGILIFSHQHSEMSGFKQFLQTVHPLNYSDEVSLVKLWWSYFKCSLPSSNCDKLKNCPTRTLLKWLFRTPFEMSMSDAAYNLYNAVYAVAHTLHEMRLQVDTWPNNAGKKLELDSWKVMYLIQKGMIVTEMMFLKGTTKSKSMQ